MSRILIDRASDQILQVEKTPPVGESTPANGRYFIHIPAGAHVDVTSSDVVLPVSGTDISSKAFAAFLAAHPSYSNIYFNAQIEDQDFDEFDLSAVFPNNGTVETRAQLGASDPAVAGSLAPNSTAILPQNDAVTPARPGMLITDTIDISAATSGNGASDLMLWWKIYEFSTSHDVRSDLGATNGQNSPAIRSITEVQQEPAGLQVFLSIDDGINYTQMGRMEPVAFCVAGTNLRVAFRNTGSTKLYLAAFAIFF